MRAIELNSLQLNAVTINSAGERWRGSHAGVPPVVPDIPEEPDVPTNPDVDENGYIIFADPEVARICAENWGDGTGITLEQAAAVTSIGTVFNGNTEITSFDELEKFASVKSLNNGAFQGCTSLMSLGLHNIEAFGASSVECQSLTYNELILPNAKSVDQNAFNKAKIKSLQLPNIESYTAGNIYASTWGDRDYIEEIILSNNITTFNDYMFYKHSKLSNIGINWETITLIGENALSNCTSLEIDNLQLSNLETIGRNAFYGVKIKKISNLGKITKLPSGTIYTQTFGDKSYLEEVVLPEGLIELPENCFSGYSKLSKVEWPTTLAKIGGYCFSDCTSLPSTLELPYITYIAMAAFNNVGIRRVILPNIETLEFGGNYSGVFVKNDIEFIHLGAKCSLIGSYTFSYAIGQTPITMICEAVTPPSLGDLIFHASIGKTFDFIYVPDASVEKYKTATNWSAYADRILPLSQYNG